MKTRLIVISVVSILPLLVVGILAIFGMIFSFWVYLLLVIIMYAGGGHLVVYV